MLAVSRASAVISRRAAGPPALETRELQDRIEELKSRVRIAVIFGGDKLEPGSVLYEAQNSRSWKSYEAVAQDIATSLGRLGFAHVQLMPDDMNLGDKLRREGIHLAWLNSGGVQGYNPTAHTPAMLEMMGVPYVGHDPLAATTLDNKHAFKREAVCAGFPTAPFSTWHMARGPFSPQLNSRFRLAFGDYEGPFVVKPVSGRASLHVHVVEREVDLADAIAAIHQVITNGLHF
jgi:D-alanine-D-alanine ligase